MSEDNSTRAFFSRSRRKNGIKRNAMGQRMRARHAGVFLFALMLLAGFTLSGCVAPLPADAGADTPEPAASGELTVFAAASLTNAMTDLEEIFESTRPEVDVLMNFAGSSRLATQIQEGAPADIFASANQTQMTNVADAGLVLDGPYLFASNRLVIITPAGNPADISEMADLAAPDVNLVLAIPGVPIRDYSDQIIAGLSVPDALGAEYADDVYGNLVSEEDNVRQVVAKIALGEADAGIVYSSDVTPDVADELTKIAIPDEINVVALYPIAQLTGGNAPDLAAEFMALVLSDEGRSVLAEWGFGAVDEAISNE